MFPASSGQLCRQPAKPARPPGCSRVRSEAARRHRQPRFGGAAPSGQNTLPSMRHAAIHGRPGTSALPWQGGVRREHRRDCARRCLPNSLCLPGMTLLRRNRRMPGWCWRAGFPPTVRLWPLAGTRRAPGSFAARSGGRFPGSSHRTGAPWPPVPFGRGPATERRPGRTSTCARRPMDSRSGCGAPARTPPLSGRCSTGRTGCSRFPTGGRSNGMRFRGGAAVSSGSRRRVLLNLFSPSAFNWL